MEIVLYLRSLVSGLALTWQQVNSNFENLRAGIYEVNDKADSTITTVTALGGRVTTAEQNIIELDSRADALNTGLNDLTEQVNTSYLHQILLVATDTYVFELEDGSQTGRNPLLLFTANTDISLTVPAEATTPFPVGTQITLQQRGSGDITISPTGGVALISRNGANTTDGVGSEVTLIKTNTNEWSMNGDLV